MIDQQELFNHMEEQHGLTLLQGEMDSIIYIVIQGLRKMPNVCNSNCDQGDYREGGKCDKKGCFTPLNSEGHEQE